VLRLDEPICWPSHRGVTVFRSFEARVQLWMDEHSARTK
jgi:hypothetical protein